MKQTSNKSDKGSLIVNADDFGLAPHINKGIINAVELGAVNSVSVVANGEALDEAVNFIKSRSNLKVGIHFTLIDEKPVSESHLVPSLITVDGFFYKDYRTFILKYINGRINPYEIKIELEAQIKKLITKGIILSHCDSHQHMHLLKRISYIVLRLCHTYWIPRIRIVNEGLSFVYMKRLIPLMVMKYFSFRIKKLARLYNIKTADRFLGFNTSMNVNKDIIDRALALSEKYTVELMCHPGVNVKAAGRYEKWGMDWDRERNILIENLVGRFIR